MKIDEYDQQGRMWGKDEGNGADQRQPVIPLFTWYVRVIVVFSTGRNSAAGLFLDVKGKKRTPGSSHCSL